MISYRSIVALLSLLFLESSCERTRKLETEPPRALASKERSGHSTMSIVTNSIADYFAPNAIFKFEDKEHGIRQELGIWRAADDSIKFVLVTKNSKCETHIAGYAINNYTQEDPETDEEPGISYPSREYLTEGDQFVLRLRIAHDRGRTKVLFQNKPDQIVACMPPNESTLHLSFVEE
ncbi:MAG: hypothetical protein QM762_04535 [Chryseolinea sp.]